MLIKEYKGKKPQIEDTCFVAENATVIGDVVLKADCSIWYGAVLRADMAQIFIDEGSNVQDNATVHCSPGYDCHIGKSVTVGHNAIVHGATIEDNVMIGMHATVLNGAVVGKNSIVAAGALVTENCIIPENSLVVGIPGKAIKTLSPAGVESILVNAQHYAEISKEHKNNIK